MKEWIVQTYVDISVTGIPIHSWMTWKDQDGITDMSPETLEEVVVRSRWLREDFNNDPVVLRAIAKYSFRLLNVNTGESIPLDALEV